MDLVEGFKTHYSAHGVIGLFYAARARVSSGFSEISAHPEGFASPIHLRVHTSDTRLFTGIIKRREYDWNPRRTPRFIIDAGANIGLTSVFFANKYPGAKIIAIEPDPDNFRMLRKNTELYQNIQLIQAALWHKKTRLKIDYSIGSTSGWQVLESPDGDIPTVCMDELVDSPVDIFKCDIEGSEQEVFSHCSGWIHNINSILIETHERFKPGCVQAVQEATRDFHRHPDQGELNIFERFMV